MHQYVAMINGEEREVGIQEEEPGRYLMKMGEREVIVDMAELCGSAVSSIIDNEAYNIELEKGEQGETSLLLRGQVFQLKVLDEREMRLHRAKVASGAGEGPAEICSPMPGKIVTVLVTEGQEVEEGQGVIVVEAMKMENELAAPKAGVVKKIEAQEGEAVDSGALLCVIE